MKKSYTIFVLLFLITSVIKVFPQTDIANTDSCGANGSVNNIVFDGNYTYVGGSFDYIGTTTGTCVKLTTTSSTANINFPFVNNTIGGGDIYKAQEPRSYSITFQSNDYNLLSGVYSSPQCR